SDGAKVALFVLLGIGFVLLLVCGGAGLGAWWLYNKVTEKVEGVTGTGDTREKDKKTSTGNVSGSTESGKPGTDTGTPPRDTSGRPDLALLVGVWEASRGDLPPGTSVEFTSNRKVRLTTKRTQGTSQVTQTVEGNYSV